VLDKIEDYEEKIPEVELSTEMLFSLFQLMKINVTDIKYTRARSLLTSPYARSFKFFLHEYIRGGLDREDISNNTIQTIEAVNRFLHGEKLRILFNSYLVYRINEETFFYYLKRGALPKDF